jgi:FtsH-binding integral membrane protein
VESALRANDMTGRARPVGWREVIAVGAVAVAAVLGLAVITALLPADAQRLIFHTPLLIGVLIVGTGLVLWRIAASRRPPEP